jgi:hypothetical protein
MHYIFDRKTVNEKNTLETWRWEDDNIKMYLKDNGCEGMGWIHLTQLQSTCGFLWNGNEHSVSIKTGEFLHRLKNYRFLRPCTMELTSQTFRVVFWGLMLHFVGHDTVLWQPNIEPCPNHLGPPNLGRNPSPYFILTLVSLRPRMLVLTILSSVTLKLKWQTALSVSQELHNMYAVPVIFRVIKSRRMGWAGRSARMEEMRNA